MSYKTIGLLAILLSVLALLFCGCSEKSGSTDKTLVVFAASSLTDVFTDLGSRFEEENPGVSLDFNFAASSTLRAQLAEGAAADVFAAADLSQMKMAQDAGVVARKSQIFTKNRLIVASSSMGPVYSLMDLASHDVKIVLAMEEVPVGAYVKELLDTMAQDTAYGKQYTDGVLGNVVSREANVRLALAKVLLGEADASIVYQSDVKVSDTMALRVIKIPKQLGPVAKYPVAMVVESINSLEAESFMNFLLSTTSQLTLERHGFLQSEVS
ncbi:molybdate ABC transporter substrate-binding protein [Dehalococcoidia bacterium]|nr:molybdate ABC transporter substrate-binding protein [Dehalococcoidia bacterium]